MKKQLLFILTTLLGGSLLAQQYCDPTSRCYSAADPNNIVNSDSLLFVAMEGIQFIPGNDCPDVTDNTMDTLFVTPDGNLLTTQNATYTDALVSSWIDWNQDFAFTSDEFLPVPGHISVGQQVLITPPDGITDGSYRVRLKLWNSIEAATNDTNACHGGNFVYQNVDFTIAVVDEIPEPGPSPAAGYCFAAGDVNCESASTNGTTQTFIDRVTSIGDNQNINNITACDVYGDYTNQRVDWTVGNTYLVSVSSGTAVNDTNNNAALVGAVYIDWNNDTIFEATETFLLSPVIGDSLFVNIIPPLDAATGLYRMRVRLTALANTPEPCGRQPIGEVEDYTVLLRSLTGGEPACVSQQFPADGATDVCTSTILTWNAVEGATTYNIRLTPKGGQPQYSTQTADTFFIPDQGLLADTTYRWLVLPEADGTLAFGCDTVEFSTAGLVDPTAVIIPEDDTIFTCKGSNIPLTGQNLYQGNLTHNWFGPAAAFLAQTNVSNPVYNNANEDTLVLYYEVTNDFGCSSTDSTVMLTLDGAKLDRYELFGDNLCEGDSLYFILKGTVGNVIIEDSLPGGSFNSVAFTSINDSLFFFDNINGGEHNIRLTVQLGDCDIVVGPQQVRYNPLPVKPIISFFDGENGTACQGEGIGMRVENHQTGMVWNDVGQTPNDTLVVDGSADFVVTFMQNGCTSVSDTLKPRIFDNPQPIIERNPSTGPCIGDSLALTVSGYASQTWSVNTADSNNATIFVKTDGNYAVEVVDINGCEGASDVDVTFFPKPTVPTITQLDPSPACEGSSIRLVASYDEDGAWSNGFTGDTLVVTQNGTFIYSSITDEGCSTDAADSISVSFFKNQGPLKVTVTPKAPYCQGDSVRLISEFPNNNTWSTGETNDTIIVTNSGSFFVETLDNNSCARRSETITLEFGAIPNKPTIIRSGDSLTSSLSAVVYEWTRNKVPLNTNKRTIVVNRIGTYELTIYNGSGCESQVSDPVQVNTVGINEYSLNRATVYPNPSTGLVNVQTATHAIERINLYSTDGKLISVPVNILGKTATLSIQDKGLYLLEIGYQDGLERKQIIIH